MTLRTFRVIKSTPIALAVCEACNRQFTSHQPLEDDAEHEMKSAFQAHQCSFGEETGTLSDRHPR